MLRGFAADSTGNCEDRNFRTLCRFPPDQVSFGLLAVRDGSVEADPWNASGRILPPDVDLLTRAGILDRETDHWVNQTSTGQSSRSACWWP